MILPAVEAKTVASANCLRDCSKQELLEEEVSLLGSFAPANFSPFKNRKQNQ